MEAKCSGISDFEMALKRAIKEDMESNKVKAPDQLFANIMESLEIKRGKRHMKTMAKRLLAACSLILFLGTSLFLLFPDKASEGGKRLVNSVTYIFAGTFHIDSADSSYPHGVHHEERVLHEFIRLRNTAPFDIRYPVYAPPEFKVSGVTIHDEETGFTLTLLFRSGNGSFVVIQREAPETGPPEAGVEAAKEVTVAGNQGFLVRYGDGRHTLSFLDERGVYIILKGCISGDELVRVAASLY